MKSQPRHLTEFSNPTPSTPLTLGAGFNNSATELELRFRVHACRRIWHDQ
jgi:hypothetical protein